MAEKGDLNPLKRPRVGITPEEYQTMLEEKQKEIDFLNKKFDYIVKENDKLRILLKKMDDESEEETSSEEEMVFEEQEIPVESEIVENKAEVATESEMESQNNAVSGSSPKAKSKTKKQEAGSLNERVKVSSKEKSTQPKETRKKSKSVPIITTYNINLKEMIEFIDKLLGHKNYNLKSLGKNVVNIGLCTLEDYDRVKALLVERKVNFYTYTPKGLRPYSVVIEGLPHSFESGDILEYLKGLQINFDVIGIAKLGFDKWVVRISRNSDIDRFYDIRYILRCRVHIRKFIMRGITQCYNCQRFGHVSTNCRMPYRCVKCGGSHGPGKCSVPPKGENVGETFITDPVTGEVSRRVGLPVRCVNCGTEGHAASSKECPRRLQLIRKVEERKVSGGVSRSGHVPIDSGLRAGVSYAAAAGAASGADRVTSRNVPRVPANSRGSEVSLGSAMAQYNVVDSDCKRFFGGGLLQCLGRMGTFSKDYEGLGSDEDKSRALLGLLMSLSHHG